MVIEYKGENSAKTAQPKLRLGPEDRLFQDVITKGQKSEERAQTKLKRKAITKDRISLYLDPDVLEWFRSTGPGWQVRMQQVLRNHMEAER